MRNETCPICGGNTEPFMQYNFNAKMKLPTEVGIRHCAQDNFLFVANGSQSDYDEYYRSLSNDSVHAELSPDRLHSPIAQRQQSVLEPQLKSFFDQRRKVLDFGCGEASLLVELAGRFPSSFFCGYDLSPATQIGAEKAKVLGLSNLLVTGDQDGIDLGSYDLVIATHVVEHLIDFDLLNRLNSLLTPDGLLYLEVPNSIQYEFCERREFLYYFDRLHVNHFTPHALSRAAAIFGFGYIEYFEFVFPYRDGGEYPALGMLFRKGKEAPVVPSSSILDMANRYVSSEKKRAKARAAEFDKLDGVLVWGAGDNFYRSMSNDGPLAELRNIVVLDRRPQEISVGDRKFITQEPESGIRRHPYPVIITVSENRGSIAEQVRLVDPERTVLFL